MPPEAVHEYGIRLTSLDELRSLDGLIFAVSHKPYLELGTTKVCDLVRDGGVVCDVKSAFDASQVGRGIQYWSR